MKIRSGDNPADNATGCPDNRQGVMRDIPGIKSVPTSRKNVPKLSTALIAVLFIVYIARI